MNVKVHAQRNEEVALSNCSNMVLIRSLFHCMRECIRVYILYAGVLWTSRTVCNLHRIEMLNFCGWFGRWNCCCMIGCWYQDRRLLPTCVETVRCTCRKRERRERGRGWRDINDHGKGRAAYSCTHSQQLTRARHHDVVIRSIPLKIQPCVREWDACFISRCC